MSPRQIDFFVFNPGFLSRKLLNGLLGLSSKLQAFLIRLDECPLWPDNVLLA